MFRILKAFIFMLLRRPPRSGPSDPFVGVRAPKRGGSGGRSSAVALLEPDDHRVADALGRANGRRHGRARAIGLAIALCATCTAAAAQPKPDFSGTWVLTDSSTGDGDFARELGVTQTTEVLSVERRFVHSAASEHHRIGLIEGTIGGVTREQPSSSATRTHASTHWADDALVIRTGSYSGPTTWEVTQFVEREEIWSLDPDATLVITITTRQSGSAPTSATIRYRRLKHDPER